MGDPAGIGPEIAAKALGEEQVRALARPLVIGDARVMDAAARASRLPLQVRPIAAIEEATFAPDRSRCWTSRMPTPRASPSAG